MREEEKRSNEQRYNQNSTGQSQPPEQSEHETPQPMGTGWRPSRAPSQEEPTQAQQARLRTSNEEQTVQEFRTDRPANMLAVPQQESRKRWWRILLSVIMIGGTLMLVSVSLSLVIDQDYTYMPGETFASVAGSIALIIATIFVLRRIWRRSGVRSRQLTETLSQPGVSRDQLSEMKIPHETVVGGRDQSAAPLRGQISGRAMGIQVSSKSDDQKTKVDILSFRIERFDRVGNRLPPVPVQMETRYFDGALHEGDQVEVRGKWRRGQAIRVSKVYNMSTGVTVKAKKGSVFFRVAEAIGWTWWVIVMICIIVGIVALVIQLLQS